MLLLSRKESNSFANVAPAVENYKDPSVPIGEAFTLLPEIFEVEPRKHSNDRMQNQELALTDFAADINLESEFVKQLFRLDRRAWLNARKQRGYLYYFTDE